MDDVPLGYSVKLTASTAAWPTAISARSLGAANASIRSAFTTPTLPTVWVPKLVTPTQITVNMNVARMPSINVAQTVAMTIGNGLTRILESFRALAERAAAMMRALASSKVVHLAAGIAMVLARPVARMVRRWYSPFRSRQLLLFGSALLTVPPEFVGQRRPRGSLRGRPELAHAPPMALLPAGGVVQVGD